MARERPARWLTGAARRICLMAGLAGCLIAGPAGCGSGSSRSGSDLPAKNATSGSHRHGGTLPPTTAARTGRASAPGAPGAPPDLGTVAWKAAVKGAVYAQPLVVGDRVVVATEDDDVYAVDLATGQVLWHTNIGTPLTGVARAAGCGDIDPLGITSTPVADPATGTVYVVGEIAGPDPTAVHHQLVGLELSTGRIVRSLDADPPGATSRLHLLQRPGLVLDGGRVDVAFGGLYGDCGSYHGWVVGIGVTTGVPDAVFDATPGGSGGAVWQSGAPPAVGQGGDLFVTTGNQNAEGTAGYYESLVKLSPALTPEASFRDTEAVDDEDFGTGAPALLRNGTVFAVGKTDIGYVLRQGDLGLVARIPGVCGSDPDGRVAYDPALDAVYVPCRGGGIQEVDMGKDRLGWKSGQVNGSPILADGSLWAVAYPSGTVEELDPASGAVEQTAQVGQVATFATPAMGGGHLLVATVTGEVVAFGGG